MLAIPLCALLVAALGAPTVAQSRWLSDYYTATGGAFVQVSSQERWLEVIEVYTLPFDPSWRSEVAQANNSSVKRYFPSETQRPGYRKATTEERERRNSDLIQDLKATSDKPMPLTVMRAWDGVSKAEVVLTFGKGQRATLQRFKTGKPLRALIGLAAPGEDFQIGRPTVQSITASSNPPSDFAAASDAPTSVHEISFGEVDPSTHHVPIAISVEKDPTPGSGVISLTCMFSRDATAMEIGYPWYVEFRLFELDKDGKRTREVDFTGENSLVSVPKRSVDGSLSFEDRFRAIAYGRIKVKSPQPWGYEAEPVRWFGVAPKSKLKATANAPSSQPAPAAPHASPQSGAESTPTLPPEPSTPEVPD